MIKTRRCGVNIDYTRLPEHMREGMQRYVEHGQRPGKFLNAVLENDLMAALGYADSRNLPRLYDFGSFLYNKVPTACYGSPEKVTAWIKDRKKAA